MIQCKLSYYQNLLVQHGSNCCVHFVEIRGNRYVLKTFCKHIIVIQLENSMLSTSKSLYFISNVFWISAMHTKLWQSEVSVEA